MHDPQTVAHEVFGFRGWLHKRRRDRAKNYDWKDPRFAYISPLVTIWHVDPETDGSDDSCGYSFPKMSTEIRERAEKIAHDEWQYMFGAHAYRYQPPSAFEVIFALWSMMAWRLYRRRRLTTLEIEEIASLASNPTDNLRSVVFDAARSAQKAERLGMLILRCYLRVNRKWYQHPKWHMHHWKLQIHSTQTFKRWAFSRCAGCGKGFTWGYSPTSTSWHGTGPRWFRGEPHIYHSECVPLAKKAAA